MDASYLYTTSSAYILNLEFEYMETYSLQRGREYTEQMQLLNQEYEHLKYRKEKHFNLNVNEYQRFNELKNLISSTQYLINADGQFHFSSIKQNTFCKDNVNVDLLKQILKTEIRWIPSLLCAPEYRDAIVFYDGFGAIVSTLNVCLSCNHMQINEANYIDGDFETYDHLKKFFISVGHEVEDPTCFIWEDIKRLKEKQNKTRTI